MNKPDQSVQEMQASELIDSPAPHFVGMWDDGLRSGYVTFGMVDANQMASIFIKRREIVTPADFERAPCYEFWLDGKPIGFVSFSLNVSFSGGTRNIILMLDSVYLRSSRRKKGLLRKFLGVINASLLSRLMTVMVEEPVKTIISIRKPYKSLKGQMVINNFQYDLRDMICELARSGKFPLIVETLDSEY